jgi:hypothetical protein
LVLLAAFRASIIFFSSAYAGFSFDANIGSNALDIASNNVTSVVFGDAAAVVVVGGGGATAAVDDDDDVDDVDDVASIKFV